MTFWGARPWQVSQLTAELTAGFDAAEVETITRFLNSIVERLEEA